MPDELQDKNFTCIKCGAQFAWTVGEQEYFKSRGLTQAPKRCKPCRQERKRAGIYGMRAVLIDALTREVLCHRCSNPASRSVSFGGGKALCTSCQGIGVATPGDDRMTIGDWIPLVGQILEGT